MAVPDKCPFDSCKTVVRGGSKGLHRSPDGKCMLPPTWKDAEGHKHENYCEWLAHGRTGRKGAPAAKGFLGFDDQGRPTWERKAEKKKGATRAQRTQAAFLRAMEKGMAVKPLDGRRRQAKAAAGVPAQTAVPVDEKRPADPHAPDQTAGAPQKE